MDKDLILKVKHMLEFFFTIISMFMLLIIGLYIPIIGILFTPIPIVLLFLRYNKIIAISSIIICILIPSTILGSNLSLILGITYVVIGIILMTCINKNRKFINSLCILSLVVFASNIVNLIVTIYIVNKSNLWNFAQDIIKNFNDFINMYSHIGVDISSSQHTQIISRIMNPQNILSTLPTIIIMFSIIIAFLIYLIAEKILIKNNYKLDKVINFDKWYLEPKIGTILIVTTCLSMVLYSKNISIAEYVYKTTYSILQFFVFIIGLSVISYFLKKKMKFNNKFCIGISILIVISPLNIMLPIIGLVDLISDIRGIDSNSLGTLLRKKYRYNS